MSYLYAKIRDRDSSEKNRKVLQTDKELYSPLQNLIKEEIPYNQEIDLKEDVWFYLEKFSNSQFALPIIKQEFSSVDFNSLKVKEFNNIDYIFWVTDDKKKIYFQNIGKSSLVMKKAIAVFSDSYEYIPDSKSIVIKDCPDAIYCKEKDKLYFRQLSSITGIFPDINDIYREATYKDTKEFLKMDFMVVESLKVAQVSIPNRRRIALALKTLEKLETEERDKIFEYTRGYCPKLDDGNNHFKVTNNKDLAYVLYGIEQRFYTTLVKPEKRIADTVIAL